MRVLQDEKAWREGYRAGKMLKPLSSCPYRPCEEARCLGWYSGYIEGKASREEAGSPEEEKRMHESKDWYEKPSMTPWENMAKWRRRFWCLLVLAGAGLAVWFATDWMR